MIVATLVQWKELWQTVAASLVAGVGVTFLFSLGIWGTAQFAELSRGNRPLSAAGAAIVASLAFSGVVGAVVVGIVVMTHK